MSIIIDKSILISDNQSMMNFNKIAKHENIFISTITISELLIVVQMAKTQEIKTRRSNFVQYIINSISLLPFDEDVVKIYSTILSESFTNKLNISYVNLIIAATSIKFGYPLLTFNKTNFERIPNLRIISAIDLIDSSKFVKTN